MTLINHGLCLPIEIYYKIMTDSHYRSSSYTDELCHGALWLYRLTDDEQYMDMAMEFYNGDLTWALGWDDKTPATQVKYLVIGVYIVKAKRDC